jgi:hypothetical protein
VITGPAGDAFDDPAHPERDQRRRHEGDGLRIERQRRYIQTRAENDMPDQASKARPVRPWHAAGGEAGVLDRLALIALGRSADVTLDEIAGAARTGLPGCRRIARRSALSRDTLAQYAPRAIPLESTGRVIGRFP